MGLHILSGQTPLLLYVAGLAAFLASAFWRPEIGIYYIVPLLPLQTVRFKLHEFPLGAQWIDLMLLGVLIGVLRKRNSILTKTALRRWLLAFAIVSYISLWRGALFLGLHLPLWFDDARLSNWKNYMVIFLLFFLVLASIKQLRQMQVLLILMCLAVALLDRSVINTMSHRDLSTFSYDIREEGAMGYAGVNGLAALEAQLSVFLLGMYSYQKKVLTKLICLALLGANLMTLMYTFSRGGYAAILVGACFIGIVKNKKLLLLLLIFLITWQGLVPNAVKERVLMTRGEQGELDPSAGARVEIWENAVEIIKGDLIFGTGFDTYRFLHAVGPYEDTHNYYIKVLLEMGLIGLVIFIGVVTQMFRVGYRLFKSAPPDDFIRGLGLGLLGMLVATLVSNAFGDRWTYIEETGFTWAIVAMAIRCQMIVDEQTASEGALDFRQKQSKSRELECLPVGSKYSLADLRSASQD
jgi:O-antigen ligase